MLFAQMQPWPKSALAGKTGPGWKHTFTEDMPVKEPKQFTLRAGAAEIPFSLTRSRRRSVKISVQPDLSVRVDAPLRYPLRLILALMQERAPWIQKQIAYLRSCGLPAPSRQYIEGENHLYLGEPYRLTFVGDTGVKVRLNGDRLEVGLPAQADPLKVEALLRRWFDRQAAAVITARVQAWSGVLDTYGLPAPGSVSFRRMKRRWGSCARNGALIFNKRLIHASAACIDYVIVHELCHLKQHDHSRAFYALLDRALPDWRERRAGLAKESLLW